jgi:hypothetical protein
MGKTRHLALKEPCFLIRCKKNQVFAICTLVVIVSGDDPQNADGVHLGWFLPPFQRGDFLQYLVLSSSVSPQLPGELDVAEVGGGAFDPVQDGPARGHLPVPELSFLIEPVGG